MLLKEGSLGKSRAWGVYCPGGVCPVSSMWSDLVQRLWVSWLIRADFSSEATGVGDHRISCKIQMVDDSHGLYWVLLKTFHFWRVHWKNSI